MKTVIWGQLADHDINEEDGDIYCIARIRNPRFWDENWWTDFRLEFIME